MPKKQDTKKGGNQKHGRDAGIKARPSHRNYAANHRFTHHRHDADHRHLTPLQRLHRANLYPMPLLFVNQETWHIGEALSPTRAAFALAEQIEARNAAMGTHLVSRDPAVAFCQRLVLASVKPIYVIPLGIVKRSKALEIARKNSGVQFIDESYLARSIQQELAS